MSTKLIHLNVQKHKHAQLVHDFLVKEKADVVCLEEAMQKDVEALSKELGYQMFIAPLDFIKEGQGREAEGPVILTKLSVLENNKYLYNDNPSAKTPLVKEDEMGMKDGNRPANRFSYTNSLLTARVKTLLGQELTVATTHFPVIDHSTPGLGDHEFDEMQDVRDVEHGSVILERLILILRSLPSPLIFTADLNNARGEYAYDSLAHELVDVVPQSLKSSIDPKLHRVKGLELMVDAVMTSPDLKVLDFKVVEGVSDHKGFVVTIDI